MSARRIGNASDPRARVTLFVDGMAVDAREGEPIATALLCAGIVALRASPRGGHPRGAFCFMGACQECTASIDGVRAQTCITPVRAGMKVCLASAP